MPRVLTERDWVGFGVVLPSAALLGYVITSYSSAVAVALVAAPALALLVVRRPQHGLLLGVAIILLIPSWYTVGAEQASIGRIAAFLAVVGAISAVTTSVRHLDFVVAGLVFVALVAWFLGDDQPGTGKIVLNSMLPAAFYLAARRLPTRDLETVLWTVLIAGGVGAATVIYEWGVGEVVFSDPNSYSWRPTNTTIFRPGGIFGTPPGAATVLAMTTLIGIPLVGRTKGAQRVLVMLLLTLGAVAVVLTFTRAGIIALALGAGVYLWLSRSPIFRPTNLVGGSVAVLLILAVVLPQIEGTRLFEQGVVRPGNFEQREAFWELALPIASSSPAHLVFGHGTAVTISATQGGQVPSDLAASPVLIERGTHNQYVLALLEQGLLGLAVLVTWLGLSIVLAGRLARRLADPLSAALAAAMLSFAVTLLVNNALLHQPSFAIAALVSGLIGAVHAARTPPRHRLAG